MFWGFFNFQKIHIIGVKRGCFEIVGYKWATRGRQVGYTKVTGSLFTSATSSGIVFSV